MSVKGGFFSVAVLFLLIGNTINAQQSKQFFQIKEDQRTVCASDLLHKQLMETDADYHERHLAFEDNMLRSASQSVNSDQRLPILTIPVVVHIMHNGEPVGTGVNISEEQVLSAIDGLNEDYRKEPGSNGDGAGADIEVEFCLASRAPNGDPTDGIIRVDASGLANYSSEGISVGQGNGANESALKALSKWDRDDYYNIWIVNEIEDNDGGAGIQGFAYFPTSSAAKDGAVILYNAFGTVGTLKSYTSLNRTATHEIGHAFYLYHTFQGGSCSETNCSSQGDLVCDTPPTTSNSGCGSPACGGTQQVENYMDYTHESCMDMFTQGQKDRMRNAINSSRSGLLSSLGCTPPNDLDIGILQIDQPNGFTCSASMAPEVVLKNFGSNTITSAQVKYRVDGGTLQNYNYSGNLSSGESATVTLPVMNFGAGQHSFEAYTQSPNGSSDGFQSNDGSTVDFEVVSGATVTVAISVDNYGNETTWDVKDSNGTILVSGGPYPANQYGTIFESEFCLAEACYDFTIYDSYGDGICCGGGFGAYSVTDADGTVLASSGTDFDSQETSPFCISPSSNPPSANFMAAETAICEGTSVQFSDVSSGSPTAWSWSFPGGSPASSSQANPTVTYANPGAKNVTLVVTNANGTDTETKNSYITVSSGITLSATTSNPLCSNGNDGSIDLSKSGGMSPFSYSWNTGHTGQDLNDVGAGTYSVTVVGQANCTASQSFTISAPSAINVSNTSATQASCSADGSATVNPTGGTGPYTFLWNDSQQQTSQTASELMSGSYTVIVTDANGCQASAEVQVSGSSDLDASNGSKNNITCQGASDGSATVNPTGGSGSYTYAWNDPTGQTAATATNLSAGSYTVTVTDGGGCQANRSFTINEPSALLITTLSVSHVSCSSNQDGSISAEIEGGTAPYTYTWNGAGFGQTLNPSGVAAGSYTLSVTDANGCQSSQAFTVNGSSELLVNLDGIDETCYNADDGSLALTFSGGAAPYTFHWNGAGFGPNTSPQNVTAGTYTATVVDANGCTSSATVSINQPPAINLSNNSTTDASCANDGTAQVTPSGGIQPFTYLWSDPDMQTTAQATGLSGGAYTVIVTDNSGCQKSKNLTVASSSDLNLDTGSKTNVTCHGDANGSASVEAQGGNPGYTYQWNDASQQTGAQATDLPGGMVNVTVTDASGCQSNRSFTIVEPEPILSSLISVLPDSCNLNVGHAVIEVHGGVGDKLIAWDDAEYQQGNILSEVRFGVYTAEISDENQCQSMTVVEVPELDCSTFTSLEEIEHLSFKIAPNPVTGEQFSILLSTNEQLALDVKLISLSGQVLLDKQLKNQSGAHRVAVPSHVAHGLYVLQISDGNSIAMQRVMIIR